MLAVAHRARRAGQMEHSLPLPFRQRLDDVHLIPAEAVPSHQMLDVRKMARNEVVHRRHLMPIGDEAIAEVRANESGAAGHQDAHRCIDSGKNRYRPSVPALAAGTATTAAISP